MATPQKKVTVVLGPPLKRDEERKTMTEALAPSPPPAMEISNVYSIDVQRVVQQTYAIQQVMKTLLQEGIHYGVVPGTQKFDKDGKDVSKPSLYQPGADKLCLLFRLRPEYEITQTETADFISILTRCRLVHIVTGECWGEGMGSANSREARYLNQATRKTCPNCKKATIFKSKKEGEGWYCWRQKEGCGATFAEGDKSIEGQVGQIVADKVHDLHNTILKISCKRSRVASVLTATAASDIFTQDLEGLEDMLEELEGLAPKTRQPNAPKPPAATNAPSVSQTPPPATATGRASPIQVRDLNIALNELQLGVAEAEQMDLRGREREGALMSARLGWISKMVGRSVGAMMELTAAEAHSLLAAARAGEMPPKSAAKDDDGGGVIS